MATAGDGKPKRGRPSQQAKSMGKPSQQSGAKARAATERTDKQNPDPDGWPRTATGEPMVKMVMAASELLPTGQFANVSVGPAQITAFIDPDSESAFTDKQKANMAKALNELAEIVEGDVIAVQRSLVLEALQEETEKSANSK